MLAFYFHISKNQKGNAMLEMIPLLIIVVVLFAFTLGFFGVVHTAILNDIAARNYIFESFRHRSDLTYLRPGNRQNHYKTFGIRFHTINSETTSGQQGFFASERRIDLFRPDEELKGRTTTSHMNEVDGMDLRKRFQKTGVNPVWIRQGYGICVTPACGDN